MYNAKKTFLEQQSNQNDPTCWENRLEFRQIDDNRWFIISRSRESRTSICLTRYFTDGFFSSTTQPPIPPEFDPPKPPNIVDLPEFAPAFPTSRVYGSKENAALSHLTLQRPQYHEKTICAGRRAHGRQMPQGSQPHERTSSRIASTICLFLSFIFSTELQLG